MPRTLPKIPGHKLIVNPTIQAGSLRAGKITDEVPVNGYGHKLRVMVVLSVTSRLIPLLILLEAYQRIKIVTGLSLHDLDIDKMP